MPRRKRAIVLQANYQLERMRARMESHDLHREVESRVEFSSRHAALDEYFAGVEHREHLRSIFTSVSLAAVRLSQGLPRDLGSRSIFR